MKHSVVSLVTAALFILFSGLSFTSCGAPDDVTNPTVKILVPQPGKIYAPEIVFKGTAGDNALKAVYVQIDNSPWQVATGTSNWMFFPGVLTAGAHRIQVYAIDDSGNKSSVESVDFYVDKDPPTFVIVAPYEGEDINSNDVQVRISAHDDLQVARVYLAIDGNDYFALDYNTDPLEYTFKDVNNGDHVIYAYVEDTSGKKSAVKSVRFKVLVDETPPTVAIFSPRDGDWFDGGSLTVLGSASDDLAGVEKVEVKMDDGDWELALGTTQWLMNIPYVGDGPHKIYARSMDKRFNYSEPASITVYYDLYPPLVTSLSIDNGDVISGLNHTFTIGAADNMWVKEISYELISGGNVVDGSFTYPFLTSNVVQDVTIPIYEGTDTLKIVVTDNVGRTATREVRFFVDNTGPQISATVDEWYNGSEVTIFGTATDEYSPVTSVTASLDNGVFTEIYSGSDNPASWTFSSPVSSGEHSLTIVAYDVFGNRGEATYTFKVDNQPPTVVIGTPADGTWFKGGDVLIAGRSSDDYSGVSKVYVSIDGGNNWEIATGTNSWMEYYPYLDDGVYHIVVKAEDLIGNVSDPVTETIYYDHNPTHLVYTSIEDGDTLGYPATITYTAAFFDAVSLKTVEFNFVSASGSSESFTFNYPEFQTFATFSVPITVAAGSNSITIHTVDQSGNTSDYYISFYVDWYNPDIRITRQIQTPPSTVEIQGLVSDYSPVTFVSYKFDTEAWNVLLANGSESTYPFVVTRENVGTSEHTLTVRAWDRWGNVGELVYNFYYDVTGPVVTIQYPPYDGYILGLKPFVVRGSSSDFGSGVAEVLYCVDYPCYVTPQAGGGGELLGDWNTASGTDSWKFLLKDLDVGVHSIHVFAIDLAGNYGYASTVSVNIAGDTVYLSSQTGSNYNSGVTTTEPLRTFDYAYEYALTRGFSRILIAEGSYDVTDTSDTSIYGALTSFKLENGINLYGGYSTDFTYYDPFTYATFVSTTAVDRVFVASGITEPTVISGLFIYNGNVTASTNPYGGGILVENSNYNLHITSCTFYRNVAKYGGGLAIINSVPHIEYSRFASNEVTGKGAGLYIDGTYSAPVTINEMAFAWNIANETDEPADGGGAYIKNAGDVILNHSTFYKNEAGNGGGLKVYQVASLKVYRSMFYENSAILQFWSDGKGGGLYSVDIPVTVEKSTFADNSAYQGGGFYIRGLEETQINLTGYANDVTITNNTADFGAGGYIEGGLGTIQNVLITDNDSTGGSNEWRRGLLRVGGGGLYIKGGKFKILNTYIGNNTANSTCGGVGVDDGSVLIDNSVVENNQVGAAGGGVCVGGELGKVMITSSQIQGNHSDDLGGGVFVADGGRMLIEDSALASNEGDRGGSIAIGSWIDIGLIPRIKLVNVDIEYNTAFDFGAGIFVYQTAGVIFDSNKFAYNISYSRGGVWYLDGGNGGSVSIVSTNNQYLSNRANQGSILYAINDSGSPTFEASFSNETYEQNYANYVGGFMFDDLSDGDSIRVENGYFEGNDAGTTGSCMAAIGESSYADIIFIDNRMYENYHDYVFLGNDVDAQGIKFVNNVFVDTTQNYNFLVLSRLWGWAGGYSNPVVVNNTFYGGEDQVVLGLVSNDYVTGYYVNNVFAYAGSNGVIEDNSNTLPQVLLNNDFYGAGDCLYNDYEQTAVPPNQCLNTAADINNNVDTVKNLNKDNIDLDPAVNNYYQIAVTSPLVDAGYDPVNDPDGAGLGFTDSWRDLDGQLRPYDEPSVANVVSAWDIGADEYEP